MAYSTQSTKPSVFMPKLADYLATELEVERDDVRVGTDESGDVKNQWIGERGLLLHLMEPSAVNVNAGAGRKGFPITRALVIKVRSRGGLDVAGQDEIALLDHWDFQDDVINALLILPHTENKESGQFPFIEPIRFVKGAGGDVKRVKNTGDSFESILIFLLTYLPKVTV